MNTGRTDDLAFWRRIGLNVDDQIRRAEERAGVGKPNGAAESEQAATPRCAPLAWDNLEGRQPPPREWIIPYWLPAGHITLLAGRAGIGKTLLAQHIGAAVALGYEYIEPLQARRVLMWAAEDDEHELWRRQLIISSHMQQSLSALTERFYLHSYVGVDVTLAAPIFGKLETTPMISELQQQVRDYRAELVILDNLARLFGGSENDRHAVTTFLAWLQGACAPAAVLLLGHPAKGAGSEFSGSTAWEGAVRARLYLSDRLPDARVDDDEAPADERVRYLARRKANYSALDVRRLSLIDGSLIPERSDPARTAARVSGEFAKDIVRRAVRTLAGRELYGNTSTNSPEYLPKLAKRYGLLDTLAEKAFASTMRSMFMAKELVAQPVGKYQNRTTRSGLVVP